MAQLSSLKAVAELNQDVVQLPMHASRIVNLAPTDQQQA